MNQVQVSLKFSSSIALATFQVLHGHMSLVAGILTITVIKHCHHHRKHRFTGSKGSRILGRLYQGTRIKISSNGTTKTVREAEQRESRQGV